MKKISQEKKQEMFELLLEKELVPALHSSHLNTYMADKAIVEALLVHGADPNYFEPYFKVPILSLAESRRNYDAFKLLLEYGANPNVQSSVDGNKANIVNRHVIFYMDNRKYFKLLLKAKVDLNILHPVSGDTLLMETIMISPLATELVQTMIDNGADPNLKNRDGISIYDLIDQGKIKTNSSLIRILDKYRV